MKMCFLLPPPLMYLLPFRLYSWQSYHFWILSWFAEFTELSENPLRKTPLRRLKLASQVFFPLHSCSTIGTTSSAAQSVLSPWGRSYSQMAADGIYEDKWEKNDDVKHNFSTLLARCYVVTSFCNIWWHHFATFDEIILNDLHILDFE